MMEWELVSPGDKTLQQAPVENDEPDLFGEAPHAVPVPIDNHLPVPAAAGVFTIEKPFLGNRLFDCVERAFEQGAKAPS